MSDVKEEGYKVRCFAFRVPLLQSQNYLFIYLKKFPFPQTSEILTALAAVFEGYNEEEKAAQLKKVLLAHSTFLRIVPSS